ncbi:MAG TPA: Type 1 glutamine amidotransferase-like domain-containing protein [Roseiflexaceae bacterium]|nr:Type 1 glutamine amidotransferase-like domain-containing protein [Roseiflexaceae bacterium]
MSPASRLRPLRCLLALLLALPALLAAPAAGAPPATRTFVPIGSGYTSATLQRFAQAASRRDTSGNVSLLVLPITFATDPFAISAKERRDNLALADTRRGQLEAACNAVRLASQRCQATLAPILVRDDAYLQSNLDLFTADLDGIYILGGDQTVAMQVVADTPTEQRMAAAYGAGVVVGGNSAGAAVQSLTMIAGYTGANGPENGLQQGSVDLWTSEGQADRTRGLIFGLPDVVLDQHEYQRGRIGRLLNAAWATGLTGVGADADTGAVIEDEARLTDVVGRSSVIILDQRTYGASGRYAGPTHSLAVRRVATHLIPPGGFGYDLARLRPLVGGQPQPAPPIAGRAFAMLRLPAGYGPLLLAGDISGDKAGAVAQRFVARSGGAGARLVVIALGYPKSAAAQADAKAYAAALQPFVTAPVQWFVLDARANQAAIQSALGAATGVFLTAPDQSLVMGALGGAPAVVDAISAAWQGGAALMADNAAAAALGQTMTADPPPTAASLEDDAIGDFLVGGVDIRPGLGFLSQVAVEPRLLPDRHWGRLYNLVAYDRSVLAIGIDVGTAVELSQAGGVVWGMSAAVTLDGRNASFAEGSNGALGARYVLLDSYVDGDAVAP